MAIAAWLGVGCAVGALAYAVGRERFPLGVAGCLVAGGLGALFGATAESVVEGSSRFTLDAASVAGAAAGAILLVMLFARAGRVSAGQWRDVQ